MTIKIPKFSEIQALFWSSSQKKPVATSVKAKASATQRRIETYQKGLVPEEKSDAPLEFEGILGFWGDKLIKQQIAQRIEENCFYLEVEADKLRIEREKNREIEEKRRKTLAYQQQISIYFNNYLILTLMCLGSFVVGSLFGVNAVPEKVTCRTDTPNLCQMLNWRF